MPAVANAQSEDEFLPELHVMVIDSTEHAVQRFCKELMAQTQGYKNAFVDRENVYMSKYYYDNANYESIKMEFQFKSAEMTMPDSTIKKQRVVRMVAITAELNVMTSVYNYIFNTTHTPDKLMAISRYEKAVLYNGVTISSALVADDYKPGYWILRFYKL